MSEQYRTVDKFDRKLGALVKLPDVTSTKASTVADVCPLVGESDTFIVRTFRQREVGDHIFLQWIDGGKAVRVPIPPAVADIIARQREALTTKVRKKVGKQSAEARKARGELPAFMRGRGE